jgi:hypothetical protein
MSSGRVELYLHQRRHVYPSHLHSSLLSPIPPFETNILTDPTRFTAITNVAFSASVGPKANVTDSYVFCQTLLDIQYPLGIQYSPVATSYHGAVNLELGADGGLETGYYYSGCPGQSLFCVIRTIVVFLNMSMNSYRTVGY